jgi:phosphate transport system substrate-binding protein
MRDILKAMGLAVAAVAALSGSAAAEAALAVGGTGASLAYLEAMRARFAEAPGAEIEVVPGLGSSGANRAVDEGALDLSISGRPLTDEEAAEGLVGTPLFRTPFGLFTSHPTPLDVPSAEVWRLFAEPGAPNPLMDGARVHVILRPEADSDQAYAKASFEGVEAAYEAARAVPGVPTAQTDQDNAELAQQLDHSLTTGTLVQMRGEDRTLAPVSIDGVPPTLAAMADGSYPYSKTFHVVHGPEPSEDARAFIAFLFSDEGAALAQELGAVVMR